MVKAILDGRKVQTRRAMRPQPPAGWFDESPDEVREPGGGATPRWLVERGPHGAPGDRLWVRETWNKFDPDEDCPHPIHFGRWGQRAPFSGREGEREIRWTAVYRADGEIEHPQRGPAIWRPAIFMPRWASRITLEITEVRVQRLQEISEDDARAEGVEAVEPTTIGASLAVCSRSYRTRFSALWDSINGKPRPMLDDNGRRIMVASRSWSSNPWVWCIAFRRVQ